MLLAIFKLLGVVAASQIALAASPSHGNGRIDSPLRFSTNGTFQMSVFEDLHYGEAEDLVWGPQQDVNSTRVMNSILDDEHPQLVVLNGHLITGENTYKENSTNYINEIVQPLLERNLPWASTYGNHDSDFNLSRNDILQREHSWPNALTRQDVHGNTSGVSNYWLPVYGSSGSSDVPKLILWFFDSRGGNYYQQSQANGDGVPQPGWVDQSVVDWFTATRTHLCSQYGKDVPSLAFVHIPVNAMLAFQQSSNDSGVRPHYEPGINADDPLAQQGVTEGQGDVSGTVSSYGGQDIPFMQALLDTPNLISVFSGHDHGDDWCFKWNSRLPGMNLTGNGLDLCFGRHSGYGGYGSWTRGSRQILVSEQQLKHNVAETWVRLETGEVSAYKNEHGVVHHSPDDPCALPESPAKSLRNLKINGILSLSPQQLALWDKTLFCTILSLLSTRCDDDLGTAYPCRVEYWRDELDDGELDSLDVKHKDPSRPQQQHEREYHWYGLWLHDVHNYVVWRADLGSYAVLLFQYKHVLVIFDKRHLFVDIFRPATAPKDNVDVVKLVNLVCANHFLDLIQDHDIAWYSNWAAPSSWAPAPSSYVPPSSSAAPSSSYVTPISSATPSASGSPSSGISANGNQWAMAYTPYANDGTCKSASTVSSDIAAIKAKGFTSVRLYATDCSGPQNVGAAAQANGLKLILGIFIDGSGIGGKTDNQVSTLTQWGQGNWGMVEMVVFGNEAIFNGYVSASALASGISSAKSKFRAAGYNGPVTTTDTVDAITSNAGTLCSAIDVVAANIHPFFNGQIAASSAGNFVTQQLSLLSSACNNALQAYNLETGWPSQGGNSGIAVPSPSDQKTAIDSILAQAGSRSVMFSFQNDMWKAPGSLGVEQFWGCGSLFSG
ncbi:hypothetical protein LTR62_004255 [Meristemomyces frigidus]|uniref:Probable beta-glucosidase btgE n=1 Tax=Meristemomyces frigidus TaxID=1508187 RepID=A0AAN7YGA7_9PEZI|nr:hypothetical protein LTR62_004255 [Meristemomyces frigidus]